MENREGEYPSSNDVVNKEQNFQSETQTQIKNLQETEDTFKNIMQQELIKDILCMVQKISC